MTQHVLFLVGRSGAGRTTALSIFEDMGYEAINNLPMPLIPRVLALANAPEFLAVGIDVWSRDFSAMSLLELYSSLRKVKEMRVEMIFFDATDQVLIQRYSQSRRRHPMRSAISAEDGMMREREVLAQLRDNADLLADTTAMSPHELKSFLRSKFFVETQSPLTLTLQSFAYRNGVPRNADMVIDCRFLNNPHWEPALRPQTGQDADVGGYIMNDPDYCAFEKNIMEFLRTFLPRYQKEGKAYFSVAFGCSGGRHRSVFMAQRVAELLSKEQWSPSVLHRELTPAPSNAYSKDER